MSCYYYSQQQSCCKPSYPKKAVNKVRFTTESAKIFIAEVTFKGFGEVEVGTLIQGGNGFCLQVPPGVKEMIVHVILSKENATTGWNNSTGEGFLGDESPWGTSTGSSADASGISAAWHIDLCTNCTTSLFMSNFYSDGGLIGSCSSKTCGSLEETNQSTLCVNCNACNSCCCMPNCCSTPASAANVTGAACDNCTEIRFTISKF